MDDVLKLVEKFAYDKCMSYSNGYEKKTDDELQSIINANNIWIQAMPVSTATYETNKIAAEKMGEMKACIDILKAREKKRESEKELEQKIKKEKENWEKNLKFRLKLAILNLPYSTSYHGQLIAAILENEDNKSLEELLNFNSELSSLDEEKIKEILDGLVKERVLYFNKSSNKYSLLTICNEELYPSNPVEWAMKLLAINNETKYNKSNIIKILKYLNKSKTILSLREIEEHTSCGAYNEVNMLLSCGVLKKEKSFKHEYSTIEMYYFSMLGERKDK